MDKYYMKIIITTHLYILLTHTNAVVCRHYFYIKTSGLLYKYAGAECVNISGREFFLPGQKLTEDQRFGHKYVKKKIIMIKNLYYLKNYT
jgi:hypothetical protein